MTAYLFVSIPGVGHVNPTIGLVEELLHRGHEVAFMVGAPADVTALDSLGIEVVRLPSHYGDFRPTATEDGFAMRSHAEVLLEESERELPVILAYAKEWRPDKIVYDGFALAGRAVAQSLGIPAIKLHASYPQNQHWNLGHAEALGVVSFDIFPADTGNMERITERAKAAHGIELPLDPSEMFGHEEATNIVFLPRIFHPRGACFDARFHFVGPCQSRARKRLTLAPHIEELIEPTRPLVFVSLGTVFNDWTAFFESCVEAFAGEDCQVLMVAPPESLRSPLPNNISVVPFVEQLAVLARADVFVMQGGMNSTMEAISSRVPLVVVPQMAEQVVTALRVEELGLGKKLFRRDVNAATVSQASHDAMRLTDYKQAAASFERACFEAGGAERAADLVTLS